MKLEQQIHNLRQFAWVMFFLFCIGTVFAIFELYSLYSIKYQFQTSYIQKHEENLQEVRKLSPTAEGIHDASERYKDLGYGAISRLMSDHDFIMSLLICIFAFSAVGAWLSGRVVRTLSHVGNSKALEPTTTRAGAGAGDSV